MMPQNFVDQLRQRVTPGEQQHSPAREETTERLTLQDVHMGLCRYKASDRTIVLPSSMQTNGRSVKIRRNYGFSRRHPSMSIFSSKDEPERGQ